MTYILKTLYISQQRHDLRRCSVEIQIKAEPDGNQRPASGCDAHARCCVRGLVSTWRHWLPERSCDVDP